MIDHVEKERRQACLRRWYFRQKSARDRSAVRNLLTRKMDISHYRFYLMLEGRTYINDFRVRAINEVINRGSINRAMTGVGVIDGLDKDIFASDER